MWKRYPQRGLLHFAFDDKSLNAHSLLWGELARAADFTSHLFFKLVKREIVKYLIEYRFKFWRTILPSFGCILLVQPIKPFEQVMPLLSGLKFLDVKNKISTKVFTVNSMINQSDWQFKSGHHLKRLNSFSLFSYAS